jgi:hypothetical protein
MESINDLKLLRASKSMGTQFVTKLEDNITIYIHNKDSNIVEKITITKDKRSTDKYIVKSDKFEKRKFIADGELQMIYFNPVIIAKVGATAKSRENIYFTVDSNIDLYE